MDFGIAGVAAITVIAYAVGQAMRALGRLDRWIPTVCAALGGALGTGTDVISFPTPICFNFLYRSR